MLLPGIDRLFDEHTLFFGSTNVCEFEGFCLGSLSDGSWGCRWYTHPYSKGNSLVCDELFSFYIRHVASAPTTSIQHTETPTMYSISIRYNICVSYRVCVLHI